MDAQDKDKVTFLNGVNYDSWKFRVTTILDELNLLEFVERPLMEIVKEIENLESDGKMRKKKIDTVLSNEKKCKAQIVMRISDNQLEHVKDKLTSYDMWESLSRIFERKGMSSQLLLRKK